MRRLLACLLALCAPVAAHADPIEDFYKGSDLTILIGHPPGGSYDVYAQLAARHLGAVLPGHPTVIVQSMPGGAASKAAAYFYNKGPQDGSMIALFPETIAYVQLMDPVQGKWDVTKMRYIGSFAPVNTGFMGRKGGGVTTAEGLRGHKINVGCSGRASQSYQYPAVFKQETGADFNLICGYDGSSAYTLALMRGEVDIVSKAWNAWRSEDRDAIENGTLIPPLMQDLTEDPHAKKVLEFISAGAAIGRALIAPPRIPAARLAALRAAFDAMVADSATQEDAKRGNILLDPAKGADIQAVSDAIVATPQDIVSEAGKAFDAN